MRAVEPRMRLSSRFLTFVRRVAQKFAQDNISTIAGGLAFFTLLSIFPFLIFLVALISSFPLRSQVEEVEQMLASVLPLPVAGLIGDHLRTLLEGPKSKVLSLSLVGALWASSRAMRGLMVALNIAFGIRETRGWLRVRVEGLLLTIGSGGLIFAALLLLSLGGLATTWLARWDLLADTPARALAVARWPFLLLVLTFAVQCLFHWGPARRDPWQWFSPGAGVAVGLWVLASMGFRVYVAHFGHFGATYGSLGAVVVMILYFYVSALATLIGGEVNAALRMGAPPLPLREDELAPASGSAPLPTESAPPQEDREEEAPR